MRIILVLFAFCQLRQTSATQVARASRKQEWRALTAEMTDAQVFQESCARMPNEELDMLTVLRSAPEMKSMEFLQAVHDYRKAQGKAPIAQTSIVVWLHRINPRRRFERAALVNLERFIDREGFTMQTLLRFLTAEYGRGRHLEKFLTLIKYCYVAGG